MLCDRDFDRLAVICFLHDMGKANRGFQRKVFDKELRHAGHVRELAVIFDPSASDPALAEQAMDALGIEDLTGWFTDEQNAYSYFLAAFSHHGLPLNFTGERTGRLSSAKTWWRADAHRDPMAALAELMKTARCVFARAFEPAGEPLPDAPEFHHRFAGLVILADWLGSHPCWFPVKLVDVDARLDADRRVIPELLRTVGLDRRGFSLAHASFHERFGFAPRRLQAWIDGLDLEDEANRLLIAESETGSGKTEAALHWFGRLFAAGRVDSLYFALPTRVAARELYQRVKEAIARWFPERDARPVTVLAVPGYAEADGMPIAGILPDQKRGNFWLDDPRQVGIERFWAVAHPKRFLAATVAVGTIDQALLSVVQTAHAHLRSICLDRALLVVDEVHASDVYTSRLLQHLLRHHLSIGGYAMLLSATLGSAARQMYLAAAGRQTQPIPFDEAARLAYPSLTNAIGKCVTGKGQPLAGERTKKVTFEQLPIAHEPDKIIERLIEALNSGARVLVVVNTVDRAIRLFRAAENHPRLDPDWLFRVGDAACPHHGRFAPADRVVLDAAVSTWLGKHGKNGPVLLIGTQTLEQSLDIDADLLVSDLAPADVLLQRVGRLHRHDRPRPTGFEKARCLLLLPDRPLVQLLDAQGRIAGGWRAAGYGTVYPDLRVLARTCEALAERPRITVPEDNRWLVEQATHPERLDTLCDPRWHAHAQAVTGEELMKALQAGTVVADFSKLFGEFSFQESGAKVATRLGTDSWRLPLDRSLESPFGQPIREIVIPDHMAPDNRDARLEIEAVDAAGFNLRWGERHYRYSRYGLERRPEE